MVMAPEELQKESDQKAFLERERMNADIARGRALQDQIAHWQGQYNNDPASNSTLPTVIENLRRELGGLPPYAQR